jgi:carbamate kinase
MRILVALGGNALLRRGQPAAAASQQKNVELAARGLAQIAAEHELIVTHGHGEGLVGYMLELALRNALPDRDLVTVLTEVVVAADDPAFGRPTKPIGPGGKRLVPSPEPRAIVELRSLRVLIAAGAIVVCAGGGGIPVIVEGDGSMRGVEAVVDKDLTAALLARRLDADLLVMLTDVDAVRLGWGSESEVSLDGTSPVDLRANHFESGSMGPKVEAACRFVEATGRRAAIGALTDAVAIVRGEAGTQVALPAPA